jgi:predicted MFS family arabinose efflux permease
LEEKTKTKSVFSDKPFWIFLFCSFASAMIFFQLFTTLPLYHKEWYGLTEFQTGLLMSFNGLMVFFMEMPIVGYLERKNVQKTTIIVWGAILMAANFFCLLFDTWVGILVVSIIILTFAEMFSFPFSNSFALSRAPRGHEGRYMALYTMTFSLAHIVSAKLGMEVISRWSYNTNWIVMGMIGLLSASALLLVKKMVARENT